jgi:hypothetical protein
MGIDSLYISKSLIKFSSSSYSSPFLSVTVSTSIMFFINWGMGLHWQGVRENIQKQRCRRKDRRFVFHINSDCQLYLNDKSNVWEEMGTFEFCMN